VLGFSRVCVLHQSLISIFGKGLVCYWCVVMVLYWLI